MDWSKAKNILIIAFIITNLFLLFNIEMNILRQENFLTVSNKYVEEVKEHLENSGVKVDTEIPRETLSMPVLFVKYNIFDIEEIGGKLLGQNYTTEENTYKSNTAIVNIDGGKKLTYKRLVRNRPDHAMDENKAIKISDDFLSKNDLNYNEIQLRQIYYGKLTEFDTNPVYMLVYEQVYKDYFLGGSYVHVYVNKYGIVGMEAMLFEYDKTYPQKRRVIPATEALLRKINTMINDNPNDEVVVSSIELGYNFDPGSVNATTWQDVESGTAFPTWRITLNNGKTYHVEGFKN